MTVGVLHDKMAEMGAGLMLEVLDNLDNIRPEAQDENLVTYAAKIDKEESKLDFDNDAKVLERKIRAFNPYPATYFEFNNERFKLLKCSVVDNDKGLKIGEIWQDDKHLVIGCKEKALNVLQIQRQGKKVMTTEELLRGFRFV
jgi:methionyl-tRNA formyltransferase